MNYAWTITSDQFGNFYVGGYYLGTVFNSGPTTLTNASTSGSADLFIVKLDAAGNTIWSKSATGVNDEKVYSISLNPIGDLYVAGIKPTGNVSFDAISVTTGNLFIAKLGSVTAIDKIASNNDLTLYPNPATPYLTIKTNSNKKQVITITNITGEIVYTTTPLAEKTIINTKDFPQGVYAVQVQAGNGVETRKVIVVR